MKYANVSVLKSRISKSKEKSSPCVYFLNKFQKQLNYQHFREYYSLKQTNKNVNLNFKSSTYEIAVQIQVILETLQKQQ